MCVWGWVGYREGRKKGIGGKIDGEGVETILKGHYGPMIIDYGINPLTLVPFSLLI